MVAVTSQGLNCLGLINDTTAAALYYHEALAAVGEGREDCEGEASVAEASSQHMLLVSMGHTSFT